jgi:DNA repair protein RecN (Recombination protein N)
LLDRLKRKYGVHEGATGLAAVIAFGLDAGRKLSELENRDQRLAELDRELAASAARYEAAAAALTAQREAAAKKLAKGTEKQVNELAMQARFSIDVRPQRDSTAWTSAGWDTIACTIATNPGEPLKPLADVASGGELSRVMLALKVSVEEGLAASAKRRKVQLPRTLVFDEIDIGIGGRAAEAVGQKLKALSRVQQVLCITHLPQIAAFADQHFLIEKAEKRGRIQTGVRQIDPRERVEEIARMLSGAALTETSIRHAEKMLEQAR